MSFARKLPGIALIALCTAASIGAEVIDRVMATVNRQAILLSDVNAARLFQLVPPAGGGDPIASTLDRLIERSLILEEVERYQPPEPAREEIDTRLAAIRQRFRAADAFPRALATVGLSEEQLRGFVRNDLRMATYINERFAETESGARETLVAEWVVSLRRRAEVIVLYLPG